MPYNKICPICTTAFVCIKISTVFCCKKCRNRARSLPEDLKMNLIKRSNSYVMRANNYRAEVPDKRGQTVKIGYEPEGATTKNPFGEEQGYIEALARNMARDRGIKVKTSYDYAVEKLEEEERLKSLLSPSGFNVVEDNNDIPPTDTNLTPASDNTPVVTNKKYNIKGFSNKNGNTHIS